MAKSSAVWGIDIGECALKALRCRAHETDPKKIVVEAFDYIEYPKLLTQPDADREELVREAVETFVSRNELKGDRVAIAAPGKMGLARFIKLPPVEAKKIPDIVKYEAKQQIPFALEDVVWDYQPLAGGSQDEGFALETEIGLFAMKRDQVARAIGPLRAAGVEVDFIQLAPLALYNYVCFDRLRELDDSAYDPASPPPSVVVLSVGTDTTDLVITNGFRVWQRNISIGGSHFTKALVKELKLTFGKAEHLKRNAAKAEDPKAVFQAMRSVFSDLSAEVQRSISFFSSSNRGASLSEVVALGNATKLPGLERYLSQNLDIPIKRIEEFEGLIGGSVTSQPAFEENRYSFPIAYGLCVQALGLGRLSTNLLPREIVTERIVRAKKPWVAATAAALMAGLALSYSGYVGAFRTVADERWKSAIGAAQQTATTVSGYGSRNTELKTKFDEVGVLGKNLQSNVDGRLLWLELLKAIDAAMPRDPRPEAQRQRTAEDVTQRTELHITSLDCQQFEDLSLWFTSVKPLYEDAQLSAADREKAASAPAPPEAAAGDPAAAEGAQPVEPAGAEPADPLASDPLASEATPGDEGAEGSAAAGPSGAGWVIQLVGYHFHNDGASEEGAQFVRSTLLRNLAEGSIQLPDGPGGEMIDVPFAELGISYPVVVTRNPIEDVEYDPEAASSEEAGRPAMGGMMPGMDAGRMRGPLGGADFGAEPGAEGPKPPETWKLRRYDFVVQFAWKPTPRHERQEIRSGAAAAGDGLAADQP